jgi:hypothetical protein
VPYLHKRVGDYGPRRGDPGLGSFLGKVASVAGSILPGPAGAMLGLAGKALSGGGTPNGGRPAAQTLASPARAFTGISAGGPMGIRVGRETTTGQYLVASGTYPGLGGGGLDACPKGYKPNRSGYHLRSGEWVEPRSRCVRIRRTQVGNSRALRKSVNRTRGFVKLVQRSRKALHALAKL